MEAESIASSSYTPPVNVMSKVRDEEKRMTAEVLQNIETEFKAKQLSLEIERKRVDISMLGGYMLC